jgi:hypothetical protein
MHKQEMNHGEELFVRTGSHNDNVEPLYFGQVTNLGDFVGYNPVWDHPLPPDAHRVTGYALVWPGGAARRDVVSGHERTCTNGTSNHKLIDAQTLLK